MNKNYCALLALLLCSGIFAQKPIRRLDRTIPVTTLQIQNSAVVLYDGAGFTGNSKALGAGLVRLNDFNDVASSIKVSPGYCAVIYEHADNAGGYGVWVDFLEDCADLSAYNFNDKTSFINVFSTQKPGYIFVRNSMKDGQFVAGHWERERANPALNPSPGTVPVVGPYLPGREVVVTSLQVNGPVTTIATLGTLTTEDRMLWEKATNDQSGIIGNDYRGIEELGSACFERASNNLLIPDNINFWYLQKQANDHRNVVYFKRTLAGTVREAHQSNISGTYQDYDINVDIVPDEHFKYLLTDAHPREYTSIMSAEYNGTRIVPFLEDAGQHDCDDPNSQASFEALEAEIAPEYWPQGDHKYGRSRLADLCLIQTGGKMCVYGPWIYDKGHCCHPEIHPAEQLWWSNKTANGIRYNCNVICDASRRFLWRNQMDDGTKLKPWGEPPIKGIFAIALDIPPGRPDVALNDVTRQYEVANLEDYNVMDYGNTDQTYSLEYAGKKLVTFIPHNNAFKVSFEHIGTDPANGNIRGFLVIETSVGKTIQTATERMVPSGQNFQKVTIPPNTDPSKVPQQYEKLFYQKQDGRYMFTVTMTPISTRPGNVLQ